jgi:histidine ammonia-lyase
VKPAKNARWSLLALSAFLAANDAYAQAVVAVQVSARVLAPCTTTLAQPQSTCSQQTVLMQANIRAASANVTVSGTDVRVTQLGGPRPKIELSGQQATVTF